MCKMQGRCMDLDPIPRGYISPEEAGNILLLKQPELPITFGSSTHKIGSTKAFRQNDGYIFVEAEISDVAGNVIEKSYAQGITWEFNLCVYPARAYDKAFVTASLVPIGAIYACAELVPFERRSQHASKFK